MRGALVSVITPSYGYGRYIGECLESVSRQTYPHVEHLVLDACSTDETRDVVEAFSGRHPVTAIFEKDAGQADAINKGVARARGEVLCWLNADDYWLADTVVEEAVALLEGGADVVTGGGWFVGTEGARLNRIVPPGSGEIVARLRFADELLQPATFWSRRVHRPLRTDLHYAFDWALFSSMARDGARFASVDREWAAYRWHTSAKTASDPARRKAELAGILREQLGPRSVQYGWARLVQSAYELAEARRWPRLKRTAYWANFVVSKCTRNRIQAT